MRFDAITLFPSMFEAISNWGITSRAKKLGLWSLNCWNPRDFTSDPHRTVDDHPFGGGPGMVLMAEPLALAVEAVRKSGNTGKVISFATDGKKLDDETVKKIAISNDPMILVCGRYEGIDQRFLDAFVDESYSLGDYVISGGELAAMVLIDAVVRRIPGAIKELSAEDESFSTGLLDAPHYTRPENWRDVLPPKVLLSGHHENIDHWNRQQSLTKTALQRPELIIIARSKNLLTQEDEDFLSKIEKER